MIMLAIALVAFGVALVLGHLWFGSMLCLRLMERRWFRAGWWLALLIGLFFVDSWFLNNLS
jgi:hypothetical protein